MCLYSFVYYHHLAPYTMQFDFLQIFGVTLGITVIFLDARENLIARPLSLLGGVMALFVYYPSGLYAKCLLNCLYIVLNIYGIVLNLYGWKQWLYGGKDKAALQVTTTRPIILSYMLLLNVLGTFMLGSALFYFSNADQDFVYWDSWHTLICLMAQWMLVRKKLESWALWVVADILYTVVCYGKGLYLFSGLHFVYIFLAAHGYYKWRKSWRKQAVATTGQLEHEVL